MLRWKAWQISAVTAGVTAAIVSFAVPAATTLLAEEATTDPIVESRTLTDQSPATLEVPAIAEQLSAAFADVAEKVRPSVVSVRSLRKFESQPARGNLPPSPFRDFFGNDFFERFFRQAPPGQGRVQQGQGTGFVISEDGYLLTNHHVIDGADEVAVQLDGETYRVEVVGSDARTDLAVLKFADDELPDGLEPLPFGDSDALKVGQWVVAVGDPFGLQSSITAGIVSATGRSRVGLVDYEDFIQTDAAINPGNSGGPLVTLRGEVVGINAAIFTRSGGYMGIGFAIPSNMARTVVDSLVENGRVVRGWLGVSIQDLDNGMAESFGYDSSRGALVGDVVEGSPAADAGFETGDIIVSFGGESVEDSASLRLKVAATPPGTEVDVEVFRDGERRELEVEIGELESDAAGLASPAAASPGEELGMSVRTLTPELAGRLGYDPGLRGVVVTGVVPWSAAARAGIRERDVILEVQGRPVASVDELRRELRDRDLERGVRLSVQSGEARRFVFLRAQD